jgi:hypothetical protein
MLAQRLSHPKYRVSTHEQSYLSSGGLLTHSEAEKSVTIADSIADDTVLSSTVPF